MGAFVLVLAFLVLSSSPSSAAPKSAPEQPPPKPPDAGDVLLTLVGIGVDAYRDYLNSSTNSSTASKEH